MRRSNKTWGLIIFETIDRFFKNLSYKIRLYLFYDWWVIIQKLIKLNRLTPDYVFKKKQKKYFFFKKNNNNYFRKRKISFLFWYKFLPVNYLFINRQLISYLTFIDIINKKIFKRLLYLTKAIQGEGFFYLRGLFIIFFIDACLTDDEPLWEPVEWSLVQTWILFIFIFAWIAENLITSRFGSYTGRDKRVWVAWYKTFWLLEFWYFLSFVSASLFVIVPFYYELTYNVAFVFSWWNWYTRAFFFKFISIYSVILLLAYIFLLNIRWLNWKKLMILVLIVNFFLSYLVFVHFINSFFAYFTDPMWYQKTRFVDFVQLSHEPLKWGWGSIKRDHFTYHKTTTSFWFKNDTPFAGSFLLLHLFLFLFLFFLLIFWLVLLRRIYTTKEVTYTYSTYCVSGLRQFFYLFLLLYGLVFFSFIANYWRFPIEFIWVLNSFSWWFNFFHILGDYWTLFFINF